MFWELLWALILGFFLSAVVQAVVSKAEMHRPLPDDAPRSLCVATGLGAASSSCSYAAVALARSLIRRGAQADRGAVGRMEVTPKWTCPSTRNGSILGRLRSPEGLVTWNYTTVLNIAFLALAAVLVLRFLRTGGLPMLNEPAGAQAHSH